jgi:hypothetical protein
MAADSDQKLTDGVVPVFGVVGRQQRPHDVLTGVIGPDNAPKMKPIVVVSAVFVGMPQVEFCSADRRACTGVSDSAR